MSGRRTRRNGRVVYLDGPSRARRDKRASVPVREEKSQLDLVENALWSLIC